MTLRYPVRLLLLGLGLGWAFDWMFYGKAPGLSVLIYASLLLMGMFLALRWQGVSAKRFNLWMPPLLLVFAASVMWRANDFLVFLNLAAVMVLLVLLGGNLPWRSALGLRVQTLLFEPLRVFVMSIGSSFGVLRQVNEPLRQDVEGKYARFIPGILKGLLISIPILLVLVPLLISADMIFAQWVKEILSWETFMEWSFRLVLMLIVGVLLMGGFAFMVLDKVFTPASDPEAEPRPEMPEPEITSIFHLGALETLIPINLVNALFLLFMGIQIPYLFGGKLNISAHKFTYAEYARRGFAELVVVAILIFGLILILHALSRPQTGWARLAFNLSSTLLLLLTVVLLVSAFKRLALYESVYGFTAMRIYPHVFMIWLGVLLLWFAGTLWLAPERLAAGLLLVSFGFVLTLNVLNPDDFVVRHNAQRLPEIKTADTSGPRASGASTVDVYYLTHLSADAVPALMATMPDATDEVRGELEKGLRRQYGEMKRSSQQHSWQSWNYARWRAHRLLDAYFSEAQ